MTTWTQDTLPGMAPDRSQREPGTPVPYSHKEIRRGPEPRAGAHRVRTVKFLVTQHAAGDLGVDVFAQQFSGATRWSRPVGHFALDVQGFNVSALSGRELLALICNATLPRI